MNDTDYVVQRSEEGDWYVVRIWIKKDAMKVSINQIMKLIGQVMPDFIKEKT